MTSTIQSFYGVLFAGSALLISACYIIKPLRKIANFILYAAFCVALLAVLCHFAPQLGLKMGFNFKTAGVAAILGLPGIALLLILNLFL